MLKYIAHILPNGEIQALRLPKGANNTPEGDYPEDGTFIKYIAFEIDNRPLFIENHYYDFNTDSFVARQPRPNPAAYWQNSSWVWDVDNLLSFVREERAVKLFASDWTQVPDAPLTPEQVEEARVYRQALRDMIENCHSIETLDDVPWPIKPSFL